MIATVTVHWGGRTGTPGRLRVGPRGNGLRPCRLRLAAVRCILCERELPGTGELDGGGMDGGTNCVTRDWRVEIEETT